MRFKRLISNGSKIVGSFVLMIRRPFLLQTFTAKKHLFRDMTQIVFFYNGFNLAQNNIPVFSMNHEVEIVSPFREDSLPLITKSNEGIGRNFLT